MRQVFSQLIVASGLLTLACATALEEGPPIGNFGEGMGGTANNTAGSSATAGTLTNSAGTLTSAGTTSNSGGKGGAGPTAFGGTATSGGAGGAGGTGKGGTSSGGAAAGNSSGGKAGTANGGTGTAGTAAGGTASAGTANGGTGTGTAGSTSATCNGVPNWTSKTYAVGDTVASTCSGVFAGGCPMGQSHKFECNPTAGTAALPWCMSREPGVGNGWGEAWLDKGQCQ